VSAAKRREGTLRKGPSLRSDDPALVGLTDEETRRFILGHLRVHGSFSGLADFANKFERTAAAARESGGELSKEFASDLARETARIRAAIGRKSRGEVDAIYLGVCAGFLFANLRREVEQSTRPARGGTLTKAKILEASRNLGPGAPKKALASALSVTVQGLNKHLRKHLPELM